MATQMDRSTRILYTNLKNNRSGAQFLAQINPKVVNIVPIHNKNSGGGGTVQGLMNKTIQRVVVSSSQPQSQQLATAFRQQQAANVNANSTQSANALLSTNAGNTLIITTSTASDGSTINNIFNDINTTSTNANSINANNSTGQAINLSNLTVSASEKLNHNDGSSTSINR